MNAMKRSGIERKLLKSIKRIEATYLGHTLRGLKYDIPRLIIQRRIDGKSAADRKNIDK